MEDTDEGKKVVDIMRHMNPDIRPLRPWSLQSTKRVRTQLLSLLVYDLRRISRSLCSLVGSPIK